MGFDRGLLHLGDFVGAFNDPVGLAQPPLDVADVDVNARRQVARRIGFGEVDVLGLVVNARRIRVHRLRRVEQRRQRFVFDVDPMQRLLGDGLGLGRHERHAIAIEAHLAVQREGVQRAGDRIRLTGGGVHDARQVLPGEHGCDARQGQGLGDVDADDTRVRKRAVQHLGHQHAAHLDIGGEGRLALRQLDGVDLGLRFPDRRPGHDLRGHLDARHDAGAGEHLRRAAIPLTWLRGSGAEQIQRRGQPAPDRVDRLAAQYGGRTQDGLYRLDVAGAAT